MFKKIIIYQIIFCLCKFCTITLAADASQLVPGCESLLNINLTDSGDAKLSQLPKCYCDRVSNKSDNQVQINCIHLTDLSELNNAIKNVSTANKNLVEIHIRGFNLTDIKQKPHEIPDNFFFNLLPPSKLTNLKQISFTDCIINPQHFIKKPTNKELLPKIGRNVFKGLENSLKSLKISNCPNLDKILETIKSLKSLNTLQLTNVNLSNVNQSDLDGFQNLKDLDVSDQKTTIEKGAFGRLKNLEKLKLSKLGLNSSIIDDINTLTSLKSLDLSGNDLRGLPDKAFAGLKALKNLILNFNYITNLSDGTFDGLNQLNTLDLRVNLIGNISKNAFSKLANLKDLFLAGNYVSNLSRPSFQNSPNLEQLDLSHNELSKIEKGLFDPLKKLKKLNLDKNERLHTVEPGSFDSLQNLRNLNLSFTNLSNFFNENDKNKNVFKALTNLASLDLSGIGLKKVGTSWFGKSLTNLYLRSNNLESVHSDVFSLLSNVRVLDVSQNPWQCDKKLQDFVIFLKKIFSKDSVSSKIQAALCAFPQKLQGSPIISAKIDS